MGAALLWGGDFTAGFHSHLFLCSLILSPFPSHLIYACLELCHLASHKLFISKHILSTINGPSVVPELSQIADRNPKPPFQILIGLTVVY